MSIRTRSTYNRAWPDPPSVAIYSFAGLTNPLADGSPFAGKPNEGPVVVTRLSQRCHNIVIWVDDARPTTACARGGLHLGQVLGCIAADHLIRSASLRASRISITLVLPRTCLVLSSRRALIQQMNKATVCGLERKRPEAFLRIFSTETRCQINRPSTPQAAEFSSTRCVEALLGLTQLRWRREVRL